MAMAEALKPKLREYVFTDGDGPMWLIPEGKDQKLAKKGLTYTPGAENAMKDIASIAINMGILTKRIPTGARRRAYRETIAPHLGITREEIASSFTSTHLKLLRIFHRVAEAEKKVRQQTKEKTPRKNRYDNVGIVLIEDSESAVVKAFQQLMTALPFLKPMGQRFVLISFNPTERQLTKKKKIRSIDEINGTIYLNGGPHVKRVTTWEGAKKALQDVPQILAA